MMFPYLAVSFTAIFWSLPLICSQICSLEHGYSKHLSSSSSMLILLGFKKGLSSWSWPKHNLEIKYQRAQSWQGTATEDKDPNTLWVPTPEIPKPLRCTTQHHNLCILETPWGQFPQAQPTCNPEGHLMPRHTGLNQFIFHSIRKTVSLRALVQCSPLYELDVSSAFLWQTLTIQHEITLLDDCLGWGGFVVFILNVAARAILPISSNEAAISEKRHISPKEMSGRQNGLENMHALKY